MGDLRKRRHKVAQIGGYSYIAIRKQEPTSLLLKCSFSQMLLRKCFDAISEPIRSPLSLTTFWSKSSKSKSFGTTISADESLLASCGPGRLSSNLKVCESKICDNSSSQCDHRTTIVPLSQTYKKKMKSRCDSLQIM